MKYIHALNTIPKIGPQKMTLLMNFFSSAKNAFSASENELLKSGIGNSATQSIIESRNNIDIDKLWDIIEKENIFPITIKDFHYPPLLKEIHNPPFIIYAKGNIDLLLETTFSLAVVGSRKYTSYGQKIAYAISKECAQNNIIIVSGLALGIDAIAHRGALDGKGKTIAVLGNSLDLKSIAPRTNFELAQEIIDSNGCLISEYPPITPASPITFPARNRIMAGISKATLVIEAALSSGSLITSSYALEYNRDIYAVPGQINSIQSEGTNKLIQNGAKLITSAKDIMEEFSINNSFDNKLSEKYVPADKKEEIILSVLSYEPLYIDIIAKLTKLETSAINSSLSILEIKGIIKNVGGQNYIKI